jgi:hypothetical protein
VNKIGQQDEQGETARQSSNRNWQPVETQLGIKKLPSHKNEKIMKAIMADYEMNMKRS